jgi:hypothetical protein
MTRLIWPLMAMVGAAALAQEPTRPIPPPDDTFWQRTTRTYRAPSVASPGFSNSSRASALVRAGNLYLSLEDAIALALENNLDLEWQRSAPAIADTDVLRASGGGLLRGLNLTITEAPPGVGGPGAPLVTAAATGAIGGSTILTNVQDLQQLTGAQSSLSITGTNPLSSGPPVPALDPAVVGQLNWLHQEIPQTSPTVAGANALVTNNTLGSLGLQKGFGFGTQVNANFNATELPAQRVQPLFDFLFRIQCCSTAAARVRFRRQSPVYPHRQERPRHQRSRIPPAGDRHRVRSHPALLRPGQPGRGFQSPAANAGLGPAAL